MKSIIQLYNQRPGRSRQRGITVLAAILLLIVIGFVAVLVMRVLPIYIDYFSARSTLEGLRSELGIQERSPVDITKSIDRRFNISYIEHIQARDIKIIKKGGSLSLLLKYEDRRPLVGNMDVIAKFNETIQLYP